MARPFLPKVHLEKGYTDNIVCIYPVWIMIYHIEVSSLSTLPQPHDHNVWCEGNNSLATMASKEVLNPLTKDEGRDMYM